MEKKTWTEEEDKILEEMYKEKKNNKEIANVLNKNEKSIEIRASRNGLKDKYGSRLVKDLTGKVFGRLTVLGYAGTNNSGKAVWWTQCSCENKTIKKITGTSLTNGTTKSCGCLFTERVRGELNDKNQKRYKELGESRIGEKNKNAAGYEMKIVEYNSSTDVVVEFNDEYHARVHCLYGNFKNGNIKNPYEKILFGMGYIGEGKYEQCDGGKATKYYEAWSKMITRCYSNKYQEEYPTYKGCSVCDEWLNYQNFSKWFEENIYYIEGQSMEVDKDWLFYNNKIYSPDACVIVPNIINTCILTHKRTKNLGMPVGISFTSSKKFQANVSKYGKIKTIGTYEKIEDAMLAYMNDKISYIKELADKYKDVIPEKLYNAMYDYKKRFLLDNPDYSKLFSEKEDD